MTNPLGQGIIPVSPPLVAHPPSCHFTAAVSMFRTEQISLYMLHNELRGRENYRSTQYSLF